MGGLRLVVELPPPLTRADTSSYQTHCCLSTAHFLPSLASLQHAEGAGCIGKKYLSLDYTHLIHSLFKLKCKNANVSKVYQICVSSNSNSQSVGLKKLHTRMGNKNLYCNSQFIIDNFKNSDTLFFFVTDFLFQTLKAILDPPLFSCSVTLCHYTTAPNKNQVTPLNYSPYLLVSVMPKGRVQKK